MRKYLIPAVLVLLPACQAEQSPVIETAPSNAGELTVRATWELKPPKKMVRAGVAPKQGFAASMGHILMVSEDGEIYTSNTGFGTFTKLSDGPFVDVMGLDRGENPSEFLALRGDGKVSLFTEISDSGFSSQELNITPSNIKGFCQSADVPTDNLILLDTSDSSYTLTVSKDTISTEKKSMSCGDASDPKSADYYYLQKDLGIFRSGNGVFTEGATGANALKVTNGFSIAGLDNSDWVFSTSAPMGNTFTGGMTLISDADSNRIIMIANDYLLKRINGELKEP